LDRKAEGHVVPITHLGGAVYQIGKREVCVSVQDGEAFVTEIGRGEGWLKHLKKYIIDLELSLY